MMYCESYCEEKGISTSQLNEAQRTLYYIAENMKMEKSISEDGYKHFQQAIKALEQEPKTGYISIDDVMSVFDDFMCGEVDEDGMNTFLEMLKDKAESEDKE